MKGFLNFKYLASRFLIMLPFLYLTNIFDPIMEKQISNYSEKKTLKVSIHLFFVMILLNFGGLSRYSLGKKQSDYSSISYLNMLKKKNLQIYYLQVSNMLVFITQNFQANKHSPNEPWNWYDFFILNLTENREVHNTVHFL